MQLLTYKCNLVPEIIHLRPQKKYQLVSYCLILCKKNIILHYANNIYASLLLLPLDTRVI